LPELILASQSPRRRQLLTVAGFHFSVRAKPVEEVRRAGEDPVAYVRRLARTKAEAAHERPGEIILGADTTVVIDHHVLEKPTDTDDARRMLHLLSGRDHTVITGICLLHDGGVIVDHSSTQVRFAPLTESEIVAYVASGEPMDKAGAYAIQGLASRFIEKVDGCYFNVMGLPLSLVYHHWKALTAPE
jgi:septum formation protein